MNPTSVCVTVCIIILMFLLFLFILTNCVFKENFTAPGLTLTRPPSWFPQNAAKPYKDSDWKVRMYLDRYPFYDSDKQKYISFDESNKLASAYRFWEF